ncbi:vesicle transport through interaction with t-SNAREs homolog 1B [Petromyzon marinus]|uniref:Vesicle transport through interaction with t-SNAREs homolog 1B n=1 Tax=Petromyzon marinus TaxID=7757 RepID=A0AAJ7TN35_PETMA|nr:vesicle transport through interaction with t-SNAREs homolog 1B [Petromyzon marinus]
MSCENFETLQEEYLSIYQSLKAKLDSTLPRCHGEEKKRVTREIERSSEEAYLLLQEMEEELKGAPAPFRMQMVSRMRDYRRDLERITRETRRATDPALSARSDLLSGGLFAAQNKESAQVASDRARLLQGTESLGRASASVERSHRVAVETEQIGNEIIDELGTQREQLDRTRDRLTNTGQNLSKSRKILTTMSRKLVTNKLLLGFIIILELGILGAAVYLKFFKK